MSGASTVPDTLIGLRQGSADRVPLPPRGSLPTPRAPTRDTELDQQVRQRLAESLQVMLDRVLDGTMELSLIPGAGRAAVLEHRGIRAILVIDPGAGNGYCLSPRELQIARMVAAGATNRSIAAALDISLWTVSTHLRRVFAKTGVASRAEMVAELFGGLHVPLED
jgi:DNA-binding CsgD family transcriptional regulator